MDMDGRIWGVRHYHNLDYVCLDERSMTRATYGHCATLPALKSDHRWDSQTINLAEPDRAPDGHRR